MTPTEAHWQEAERQHKAFTGIDWFPTWEPGPKAIAQLVADGATSTPGYKPSAGEIEGAVAYVNKFFDDGRSYSFASAEHDRRFWMIASMLASLGRGSSDPLSDTERAGLLAQIAERDAKLAAIRGILG